MVDVTLIQPLNKVKITGRRHMHSAQTRTEYSDRSFAVQGPRIWNSLGFLLSCELQKGFEIFNRECDAMIE